MSHAHSSSDADLCAWRERTLRQLHVKLRRTQPSLTPSHFQHALSCIEAHLFSRVPPSPTTSPVPLSSIDVPTLFNLRASPAPFYSNVDHLSSPLQHLTAREVAFASAFPAPSPSLALLPPRPFLLVGRLCFDAADAQRLQLVDDTAALPCHVIHANVSMLDRALLCLRWNLLLISGEGGGVVLEVDASQAVVLTFDGRPVERIPIPPSYRPHPLHLLTPRQMKRLSAAQPSASQLPAQTVRASAPAAGRALRPTLHLRGVVVAKSPMVQRKEGSFYFVQLAATAHEAAPSVFVIFHGEASLRWYHALHVDGEYLLACLRVKALTLSGDRREFVFVATTSTPPASAGHAHSGPPSVEVFSAASSQLPEHRSSSAVLSSSAPSTDRPPSQPTSSPAQSTPPRRSTHAVSYRGLITRQVAVCVYELDHGSLNNPRSSSSSPSELSPTRPLLRLYVTRYDCAALYDGVGLRPGCVVRLHHVHRVYHSGRFLGLGCCARSHLSIDSFSPLSTVCRPLRRQGEQRLLWAAYQSLDLPDTALFLDCLDALLKKWGKALKRELLVAGEQGSAPVLHRLLPQLRWGHGPDIYDQVLHHHEGCTVAPVVASADSQSSATRPRPLPSSRMSYPTFPSLSSLLQLSATSHAFDRLRGALGQDSHSSTAWHCERVPSHALLRPGAVYTAYLSSSLSTFTRRLYSFPCPVLVDDEKDCDPLPDVASVYTGLQLTDSASSTAFAVDCLVTGRGQVPVGGLYRLTAFELVMETVPLPHGGAVMDPTRLTSTVVAPQVILYIVVSAGDLDLLVPPAPRPPPSPATQSEAAALAVFVAHRLTKLVALPASGRSSPVTLAEAAVKPSSLPLQSTQWGEKKADDVVCVASRPASSRCAQTVDCSLHARLVTAERSLPQRVQIALRGHILALAPLLCSGQILFLSSCQRTRPPSSAKAGDECYETGPSCTLSIDSSPAAAEWVARMQPHLPPVLSVADLLVSDVALFGQGRVDPALYSFECLLVEKQFRCDPLAQVRQERGLRRSHSAPTQSATSSFALSVPGRWFLKVRDVRLPHTIDVYVPLSQRVYPAGVVPGAMLRVSGAMRKAGSNFRLFIECSHSTDISVLGLSAAGEPLPSPVALPTVWLSSFPLVPLTIRQHVYRVRCRVVQVKQLHLSLLCLVCGRVVRPPSLSAGRWLPSDGRCGHRGCRRVELRLHAQLHLDDGTATALAMVEGPPTWDVLGLSRAAADAVRQYVGEVGELHYNAHVDADPAQVRSRTQRGRVWGSEGEEGESSEEEGGRVEVDYAAVRRERLLALFRTVPKARPVVVHVQQLVLRNEGDACRAWLRRRMEAGGRVGEGVQGQVAGREAEELELVLSTATTTTVKGSEDVSCVTMKPAGFRTFRVLQCTPVRAVDEARALLSSGAATAARR